jgi:hypothetical protein
MEQDLDLPDAGCWTALTAELRVGDVCRAVPLPRLERGAELAIDPGPPRTYWVEAEMRYALVLGLLDVYAVLAPISLAEHAQQRELFDVLVDSGRSVIEYVRLPRLDVMSEHDAVALMYCPHTRLRVELEPLRVASMSDAAQRCLSRRTGYALGLNAGN